MRRFIPSIVLAVIGGLCVSAYWIIGAEVMPDGRVVEPFFLSAIGALLILSGIVSALIIGIFAVVQALVQKNKAK